MLARAGSSLNPRTAVARLPDLRSAGAVWVWAYALRFLLSQAVIFPRLYEIHPADEMGYLYSGRWLMNGFSEGQVNLVPFGRAPLVMFLHALFYAPVHKSVYWISFTSWGSRFFLFTLLWVAAYLVGKELRHRFDWRLYLALVFVSPAIPRLLDNSSDALFAAMSSLALWQLLVLYRTQRPLHLVATSVFVGLATLSRNDGLVLFAVLILVQTSITIRRADSIRRILRRALEHLLLATIPFVIVVGGYLVLVRLAYGEWLIETGARAYFAFEQAEGVAYSLAPEALIDGVWEARQLYGTPEDNDYSVARAIQANPTAFMRRLLHLPLTASVLLVLFYGGTIAIATFVLAAIGAVSILRRRRWPELLIVLAWPTYLLVYVVFLARGGYLLTPYAAVLAISAAGATTLLRHRSGRRLVLVAATIAALNFAFGLQLDDDRMLANTLLVVAFTLLVASWDSIARRVERKLGIPAVKALGSVLVISSILALLAPYPRLRLPQAGTSPEEQAGVYLTENFPRHAVVASHMPTVVFMAKMNWRPMVWDVVSGSGPQEARVQEFALESTDDLMDWIAANQIDAIYLDYLLWHFQPELYSLIEQQIGKELVEVFSISDSDPARAEAIQDLWGIQVTGRHRIVVPRFNTLEQG